MKQKELKDLTVLFVDHGLFVEQAVRMSRDCKRVLYHVPNSDPFPMWNPSFIGTGLGEIEIVDDVFGEHFPYVDLYVFPDVGFGHLQEHLETLGKPVWGSRTGEILELDRPFAKDLLREYGLPVGKHRVVKGMKALRAYLKNHEDVFVKVSKYRGTCESFNVINYKTIEPKLAEIEFKLGPLAELMEFDVEDALPDRVEVGSDTYSVDGELPSTALRGIEIKDAGYGGRMVKHESLSEPQRRVDEVMSEILGTYGYRGFFSNEIRIGKDQIPYMIDATCRCPNPPSALYSEMYENFSEIIWQGANGNLIDPVTKFTHGVQLQMKSSWADAEHFQPIDFPEKFRRNIKISNGCKIGDQYYHVPLRFGLKEVGCVLGWGNSYDEAIKMASDIAEEVSGYDLNLNTEALEKAKDQIQEAGKVGIDLS